MNVRNEKILAFAYNNKHIYVQNINSVTLCTWTVFQLISIYIINAIDLQTFTQHDTSSMFCWHRSVVGDKIIRPESEDPSSTPTIPLIKTRLGLWASNSSSLQCKWCFKFWEQSVEIQLTFPPLPRVSFLSGMLKTTKVYMFCQRGIFPDLPNLSKCY